MRFAILCLAACTLSMAAFSSEADKPEPRYIQVDAVADQIYSPDRAHLNVQLKAVTKSFATSASLVDAAQKALVETAASAGVAHGDVGVQFRSMGRHYEWKRDTRIFKGNGCTQRVEVVVRDLSKIGEFLEALASIPNLELEGLVYRSSREPEAKRRALLDATRVAREKADAIAESSGVRVTALWSLVEQGSDLLDSSGVSYSRAMMSNSVAQTSGTTGEYSDDSGAASKIIRVSVRARFLIE